MGRQKKAEHGWSFDERLEPTPGVSMPSIEDYATFELPSAYDLDYWRKNPWMYRDKVDLNQEDFDTIIKHALEIVDLETYSCNKDAALASALELAIWSLENGKYQSKIHPNVFQEMFAQMQETEPKKISDNGQNVFKKLKTAERLLRLSEGLNRVDSLEEETMNMKQAAGYVKRLDKIADQIKSIRPDLSQRIWVVADWLEGDKDEAKYMKRFDFTGPYERDKDEKYMDRYDDMPKEPARHSEVARRVEGPIKDLNTTPKTKNPHIDKGVEDYHWASTLKSASAYLDKLADWVEEQGDEEVALRIDQISDGVDEEIKDLEKTETVET